VTTIDVEVGSGWIDAIPVPPTSTDLTVLTGESRIVGWSLRDTSTPSPAQAEGSTVAPAAGAAIVTLSGLRAGTYDVSWTVELLGAAAAADANNFEVKNGATVVETSLNAGAAGTYPQVGVRITVLASGSVSINAVGAGTAGVTYLAQIEMVPSQIGATVVEIQDSGNILGEVSLGPGGSETDTIADKGVPCQGQIKVHVVQGQVTGVIYAYLERDPGYWR
jgi:hypothetical protein